MKHKKEKIVKTNLKKKVHMKLMRRRRKRRSHRW
jgi:hypothetical protein